MTAREAVRVALRIVDAELARHTMVVPIGTDPKDLALRMGSEMTSRLNRLLDELPADKSGDRCENCGSPAIPGHVTGRVFCTPNCRDVVLANENKMKTTSGSTCGTCGGSGIGKRDDGYGSGDEPCVCVRAEGKEGQTFTRDEDEQRREMCIRCGKHVGRHYGGKENRCYPRATTQVSAKDEPRVAHDPRYGMSASEAADAIRAQARRETIKACLECLDFDRSMTPKPAPEFQAALHEARVRIRALLDAPIANACKTCGGDGLVSRPNAKMMFGWETERCPDCAGPG